MINYAVIKGRIVESHRAEDVQREVRAAGNANYVSNHFHIVVEATGERWRCPVNVLSQDRSEVWFKIRDAFTNHPILDKLPDLPIGLTELPEQRSGSTLDYVREPLFDRLTMQHLPVNVAGGDNDVQDHLALYASQAQTDLEALVYVFGSFWKGQQFPPDKVMGTNQGVHDVHMNQGNDPGHRGDDRIFHDGGVFFYFPSTNRYVGAFLAFNSQVWFTDNNGHRQPGFPEGPLASGTAPQPQPDGGPVPNEILLKARIIAALINPDGVDAGLETVTLFNSDATDLVLDGWSLLDRGGNREPLDGVRLPRNNAVTLTLTGRGAQLGNNGGSLRLMDPANRQAHVVTWTHDDARSGTIVDF